MSRRDEEYFLKYGIPNDIRGKVWMSLSGAQKKRDNADANTQSGSYYRELVSKNKQKKKLDHCPQIEKVILEAISGYSIIELLIGFEKNFS